MKRLLRIFVAAAAVAAPASCTKETAAPNEAETDMQMIPYTIQASLGDTKASLNGLEVNWQEGDKIAVYDGKGKREFTLVSGQGTKNAVFQGSIYLLASKLSAVSPYSAAGSEAGTYNLPANQTLDASSTIDPTAMIMVAPSVSKGASLTFSNPCGIARMKIPEGTKTVEFSSGEHSYSLTLSRTPSTDTTVYMVLPPQKYAGIKITLTTPDGSFCKTTDNTLELNAGEVVNLGNVQGEIVELGIYGYVKYSDGSPAGGVSVSNGFDVAVTSKNGHYTLPPSSDCRFIYISYPADAKITTGQNGYPGCPDFFKTYSGEGRYDFTLIRQEIETQFNLFALADPQAHYVARGTQLSADITRFKNEAVPDINKKIAASAVPCYGVTLGDVVYSEDGRNSNPGMTQMREGFAGINMPVFQTMGNHDYSYFYGTGNPLKTSETSSTLYLAAQRAFEECFGPVNFSFNRGDVHIVCMRNVNFDSITDAGEYHGGFTSQQYDWLVSDLGNVAKDKMVILCVHIPVLGITAKENVTEVLNLIKQYKNSTIFSGHTHYYRGYPNVGGSGMFEHVHSAVCGQWWWSRMEGDGCPNGYSIYLMDGASIKDAYYTGYNDSMNTRDYQMRIYRGDVKTGGKYAYFQWPHSNKTYLINVFNGDSRWTVKVYENGVYAGKATLMKNSKTTYSSVTAGTTYTVPATSNQDWWAIGYHIGVCKRGTSSTSYYTNMFHMWKYTASSESAKITVEATDPYGNTYTCEDIISDGNYPEYVKAPLSIF